jgi:hypothetical protein
MAATKEVPKIPFRLAAREHITQVGVKPFAEGSKVQFELPKVGWLSALFLRLHGTVGVTTGGGVATFKNATRRAWDIVSRMRLEGNGGQISLIDLQGFSAYLVSHLLERSFKIDAGGAGSSSADPSFIQGLTPATDVANKPFDLTYVLPVSAGHGMNFETGLVNLQAEELTMNLTLDTARSSEIYATNAPVLNGLSFELGYRWFEMPDEATVELPPPLVIRTTDKVQALINGENAIKHIRQGTLMQAITAARTNGVYQNAGVDKVGVKLNKNSTAYDVMNWQNRIVNRIGLGVDLPEGVNLFDFYHASQSVSEGDSRDMFDLEQYSTFESIVNVPNGFITDTATSDVTLITRTLNELH